MQVRPLVVRVFMGVVTGGLATLGSSPSAPISHLALGLGPSTVMAANNCQYAVGHEYTGIYDAHGYGGANPASAIVSQISINQPGFICNSGAAYWDGIDEPASQCTGSAGSVYDQMGWLIDGSGNPQHFYEHALLGLAPNCDPGPYVDPSGANWWTSHNYKIVIAGQPQGIIAEFTKDGVVLADLLQDWQNANSYDVAGEISFSEEYLGGQTFRSIYHCENVYGCTPNVAVNVGGDCPYNSGDIHGCLGPTNPNGCYYFNSSSTTYNGFNIYEKRSQNPPSC